MLAVALGLSFVTIAVWVYLNKKGTPRIFNWARVMPVRLGSDEPATSTVMGRGALKWSEMAMQRKSDPVSGMSLPKINLPVPIDGDIA